jgi:hypothetical protein
MGSLSVVVDSTDPWEVRIRRGLSPRGERGTGGDAASQEKSDFKVGERKCIVNPWAAVACPHARLDVVQFCRECTTILRLLMPKT